MAAFLLLLMGVVPSMGQNRRTTTTTRRTTTTKTTTTRTAKSTQPAVATKPRLVDLGLPSGNLWADRNIGATSVTNFGGYYAFGELKTKSTYTEQNYKGPGTNVNIAGTEYDVATKKYGEGWQMPSEADFQELLDNCVAETVMQGTAGLRKFPGPNGNSILFPFPKEDIVLRVGDYEMSKEICAQLTIVKTLKQAIASYKKQMPNAKLGAWYEWMSTGDCKILQITGVYAKDLKTGEEVTQSPPLNNPFSIREGEIYCGVPIRAIFRQAKDNSSSSDADITDGEITLDGDEAEQDASSASSSFSHSGMVYNSVDMEQKPTFPDGDVALREFLINNLNYPPAAADNGVQGRVLVDFVVELDGTLTDVKVSRGVDPSLDKEALRLVMIMPKWNPGKKGGRIVRVKYTFPVTFRLQ